MKLLDINEIPEENRIIIDDLVENHITYKSLVDGILDGMSEQKVQEVMQKPTNTLLKKFEAAYFYARFQAG